MKRSLLLLLIASSLPLPALSQCNTFYPVKEGVKLSYDHFDKKEKPTVRTIQSFKNISGSGKSLKATVVQEIIDLKKNKTMTTTESTWSCENGVLSFNINSLGFGPEMQNAGPGMSMEVTGDQMDIPSSFSVGQKLKDLDYRIGMSVNGISMMNNSFAVRDREVVAQESITTPAGTFNCYKVTFTTKATGMGSRVTKSAIWYSEGAGMVKSENYSEDGKLISRQVLVSIEK